MKKTTDAPKLSDEEVMQKFVKEHKFTSKKVIKMLEKKQKIDDELITCLRNSLQNLNAISDLSNEKIEDMKIGILSLVMRTYVESGLFSDELNMELVNECKKQGKLVGEDFQRIVAYTDERLDLTQFLKFSKEEDYDNFVVETMMMVMAARLAKVKGADKFKFDSLKKCFAENSKEQKMFSKTLEDFAESGFNDSVDHLVNEALKIVPNMKDMN